ncbi:MAG: hypothetical protein A2664_02910 [Candidatus Taylorbacteria bacterium RIFCSPHIGHO2_01_FULL_46_22b]|uniref:Uncharacterized protein n=1 Tax=Candidatus Taylorbacteria bacterium RIFCSPHIGHO2_01_FULL_46_22b TaxID=1802301 RepID=A0A1G2M435_9BACT|nr:MAG: hypothetical protein A2664_02910 [Candidatus Taylorbacteria bacterium RIFCSPHIGHO2_01_FULL_46_22b]
MKFFTLTKPVSFSGRTTSGFKKTTVTFIPPARIDGWDPLYAHFGNGRPSQIDLNSAVTRNWRFVARVGRIVSRIDGVNISAVEHYSALRFLFPGLYLVNNSGQTPPYIPCTGALLETLFASSREVERDVPWFTVDGAVGWQYPKPRGGIEAFTLIEPNPERSLKICVTVKFKEIGERTERFEFPNEDRLRQVLSAPALGRPAWIETPARLLWHHAGKMFWARRADPEHALRMIIRHRVDDILGAVALLPSPVKGGFPSLSLFSQCSGHLADMNALNMLMLKGKTFLL